MDRGFRAGRLADGWFLNPRMQPGAEADQLLADFQAAASEAGRDYTAIGLEATIFTTRRGALELHDEYEAWRERGVSHVTLRTMTAGYGTVREHLTALEAAKRAIER